MDGQGRKKSSRSKDVEQNGIGERSRNLSLDTKIRAYSKTSQLRARSRQLCEQSKVLQEALHSTVSKSRIIVEQSSALYLKIRSFHSFSELALSEGPARKS